MEEKKVLIKGKHIQLRTTVKSDMELKVRWYNDPDVNKTLVLPEKLELDKTYEWFEKIQKDTNRFDMVIETIDAVPIGVIGLKNINKNNRSALLYIVIGEKDYWGRGLGLEAELLAIHYGFEALGLHRVLGTALENNPASIAVCKKVGFVLDGTSRDDYYKDGKFYNVHKYSVLKDEFYAKHPEFQKIQILYSFRQAETSKEIQLFPKKDVVITGHNVCLRPLKEQDLETRVQWFNATEINKYLILNEPLNLKKTLEWFEKIRNEHRYDFVIETLQARSIGCIGFRKINKKESSAVFYIIIGEKDCWKKGIGTEASKLLINWGFDKLGLKKIQSTVKKENKASTALLKKLGFEHIRNKTISNNEKQILSDFELLRTNFK